MADTLYLVTRAAGDEGKTMINGVFAVVINKDSGDTTAQKIAAAVAQCNAAAGAVEGPSVYPATYFDTVTAISDLGAGPLADINDCYVFGGIGTDAGVTKVEG